MNVSINIRERYDQHKGNARGRGIAFQFTFEDWVNWWEEHLGYRWFEKRGRNRGQYVMARYKDRGAYVRGNVKCILAEDNNQEKASNGTSTKGMKNPAAKLTDEQVRKIYLSVPKDEVKIMHKYDIRRQHINMIKKRAVWGHITMELPEAKRKGVSKGANHWNAKLTPILARRIYLAKGSLKQIAQHFEVTKSRVQKIKNGSQWRSVTGPHKS